MSQLYSIFYNNVTRKNTWDTIPDGLVIVTLNVASVAGSPATKLLVNRKLALLLPSWFVCGIVKLVWPDKVPALVFTDIVEPLGMG